MRIVVGFQSIDPSEEEDYYSSNGKMNKTPSSSAGSHSSTKSGCGLDIIDYYLKRYFFRLGHNIGEFPIFYIIIPIFISLLLGTGMQRLRYTDDPEYLFSPVNGQGKFERTQIEKYFPMNYTKFHPSRFIKPGRFLRVFIVPNDNETLLRASVFSDLIKLNEVIHNVTIEYDENKFTYNTLCASWNGECYENDIFELNEIIDQIEAKNISLTYPIMLNPITYNTHVFPFYFGGVRLSNVGTVENVKALQLNYFLSVQNLKENVRGEIWEKKVLGELERLEATNYFQHIKVSRFAVRTLATELEKNTFSILPYFSFTIVLMIVFTVITCMMFDCVKSKPWLGLAGVISSVLGSLAAFGLVCYCDVEFIGINMAAPFLMLGIGIDDTFVMLASWRRTSAHDSVAKRMGEAYSEAAVSITITSITDMLSFWVGVLTPFPCVQIFSIYSGAAVIGTYIWHILFFGGCIALSGYFEKRNMHSLFCWMGSTPKSQSQHLSLKQRLFFTGGINPNDPYNPIDNTEHGIMIFFRDYLGSVLNNIYAKLFIILLFVVYLSVACWGSTQIQEGLERRRMVLYNSYAAEFFDIEDLYFREYPYRIQVMIEGDLDYSNKTVQDSINKLLTTLESSKFISGRGGGNIGSLYTESWLRSFLRYVENSVGLFDYNITTEIDFINTLREDYLDQSTFFEDVRFNENHTKIIASRFIIQTINITNSNDERDMAMELRDIAASFDDLNVTVFHPFFIFFDQFLLIRYTSIQCVLIAAIIMMGVSLIFIPNPLCSLWVAFSIISIEIGVIGYMTLWNVNLDAISMINLIMCIGFSVDFSAHISYSYMSSSGTPEERIKQCLYSLGLPIIQGAISTILGVIALLFAPSYIFITFFKIIFLVIIIAAGHGLLLLPVLLSLFGPGSCSNLFQKNTFELNEEMGDKSTSKDKIVPYSFVISPSGLNPNQQRNIGLNGDGQFINNIIPRVTNINNKIVRNPSRNMYLENGNGNGVPHHPHQYSPHSTQEPQRKKSPSQSTPPEQQRNRKSPSPPQAPLKLNIKELYNNNNYMSEEQLNKNKLRSKSLPNCTFNNTEAQEINNNKVSKKRNKNSYIGESKFP